MENASHPGHEQRNRRVAMALVGWIALLSAASLLVVWMRH